MSKTVESVLIKIVSIIIVILLVIISIPAIVIGAISLAIGVIIYFLFQIGKKEEDGSDRPV